MIAAWKPLTALVLASAAFQLSPPVAASTVAAPPPPAALGVVGGVALTVLEPGCTDHFLSLKLGSFCTQISSGCSGVRAAAWTCEVGFCL